MQKAKDPLSEMSTRRAKTGICVGAGRTLITPKNPAPLAGRINRDTPYTSIASDLEANVIVLRERRGLVVLVGVDLLFASIDLKSAVLRSLESGMRSRIVDIVFVATHTHHAPAVDRSKRLLGEVDETYLNYAAKQIAALIAEVAVAPSRGNISLWRGKSSCSFNASRRHKGLRLRLRPLSLTTAINMVVGKISPELHDLHVVVAKDAEGKALWVTWQWTCHATTFPEESAVSSDFPGVVREFLRRKFGHDQLPVVFLPGFCGDIRPDAALFPFSPAGLVTYPLQRPFARTTPRSFAAMGHALIMATTSALQKLVEVSVTQQLAFNKVAVPLADLLEQSSSASVDGMLEILVLDGGDFGMLLLSAEPTSHYAQACRRVTNSNWLMSGYCNHVFGYMPSDNEIAEGGYEVEGFFHAFSLKGRFARAIEQHVLSAIKSLTACPKPEP